MNRQLLINLHEIPEFQILLQELKKNRPIIPHYDYKTDNVDQLRAFSLMQQGFDLALLIINPFTKEN